MLVYPQLQTGATAQYPIVRRRVRRTVTNIAPDGTTWQYRDTGMSNSAWSLSYSALNSTEVGTLQSFFNAVEGRLTPFTFLDPIANLFVWSEDFKQAEWHVGPVVQTSAGIADPFGGTRAFSVVNAGQGAQRISQILSAPASFQYCVSVYVRSAAETTVRLVRAATSAGDVRTFDVSPNWRRIVSGGALGSTDSTIECGLELDAGAALEIFGLQVEAQPAASGYKRTGAIGGVFPAARFDQDELQVTSTAPNLHNVTLKIVSTNGD